MSSFPTDAAENTRLAIKVMASFVVGDDPVRSWANAEDVMAQDCGAYRSVQGFITLSGMLLQEFEFNVDPPTSPETMLQEMADFTIEHPDVGKH
jgi:hypothetical protein